MTQIHIDDNVRMMVRQQDMVTLIQRRYPDMQVRNSPSGYVALCPFHHETEPSFTIFDNDDGVQTFYCYGCHAGNHSETGIGSDIIALVMAKEQLCFHDAIATIIGVFGLTYTERIVNPEVEAYRQNIYAENIKRYTRLINEPYLLQYLYNRGLTAESIHQWQLGFADINEYIEANRNTLVIPIIDSDSPTNNIIGSAYRNLEGEIQSPDNIEHYPSYNGKKYRNDPNSEMFTKGNLLYGLPFARKEIRRKNHVIICEGYFDTILMHQIGITHTVSAMGTALTEAQCKLIKQQTNTIYLMYDNDTAGSKAMAITIPNLYSFGFEVYVIEPPNGLDVADMILHYGTDKDKVYNHIASHTTSGYEYITRSDTDEYKAAINKANNKLLTKILPIISKLNHKDRLIYAKHIATITGVSESAILLSAPRDINHERM